MSYLGKVDMNDANIKHYSLTGSTLTVIPIGWTPASEQSLRVTINGVVQQGDTFSYSGSNLTLGGPLVVTDTLEVVGIQSVGNIITPADNSVTTTKLADDAVTLAKMAGGTDGNLITYDASGDPAYVATGSATNVLTSNGAGAAPTFQAAAAGGGILQVKTGVKTDSYTATNTGPTDWKSPGLSVVITPTLNTSKILVMGYCVSGALAGYENAVRWVRTISGGSAVYLNIADTSGSMTSATSMMRINAGARDANNASFMFLDAPATTTATTYHVEISVEALASDVYFNRTQGESDTANDYRGSSSITVMEIAVGVL